VISSAIEVHKALGPGLLESTYRPCLVYELADAGLKVAVEQPLPIIYKNLRVDRAYKMDIVVEDRLLIELKSVARLDPIHEAQLLNYLKLSGLHLGLLINFNVKQLIMGVRRLVNGFPVIPVISVVFNFLS
jgi:GxxExxY protein